jgi:hypothetical protein
MATVAHLERKLAVDQHPAVCDRSITELLRQLGAANSADSSAETTLLWRTLTAFVDAIEGSTALNLTEKGKVPWQRPSMASVVASTRRLVDGVVGLVSAGQLDGWDTLHRLSVMALGPLHRSSMTALGSSGNQLPSTGPLAGNHRQQLSTGSLHRSKSGDLLVDDVLRAMTKVALVLEQRGSVKWSVDALTSGRKQHPLIALVLRQPSLLERAVAQCDPTSQDLRLTTWRAWLDFLLQTDSTFVPFTSMRLELLLQLDDQQPDETSNLSFYHGCH